MNLQRSVGTVILGIALLSQISGAQEITAAADLQFALKDVATRFEKETGKGVRVIYGSSSAQVHRVGVRVVSFRGSMSHPAYPLSTLRWVPRGSNARLEAKWIATPFL